MMTPHTVQQLIRVFSTFRDNYGSGVGLRHSYTRAVRTVADASSVTYQTIGDGCRRRLGLTEISELYELLHAWVNGEPQGLARQLKDHSARSSHSDIELFFSSPSVAAPHVTHVPPLGSVDDRTETFQFRLPEPDARVLKALAALDGISAPEIIVQWVTAGIRDRKAEIGRDWGQ